MLKKIFVCFIIMICSVAGVFGSVEILSKNRKTNLSVQAGTFESVSAATADITEVQKRLKKWGYYTGEVDGINGCG